MKYGNRIVIFGSVGCFSYLFGGWNIWSFKGAKKDMKETYLIKTKSKLLVEFAKTPEGGAIVLLVATLPFWGIARVVAWLRK